VATMPPKLPTRPDFPVYGNIAKPTPHVILDGLRFELIFSPNGSFAGFHQVPILKDSK
jgi:hypothetical protein